jgi:hypothetical protein
VESIFGGQPRMDDMQAMRQASMNGTAKPINRVGSLMNSHHNRFADVLEPATAK